MHVDPLLEKQAMGLVFETLWCFISARVSDGAEVQVSDQCV
jgi:hypothetical protein